MTGAADWIIAGEAAVIIILLLFAAVVLSRP
jgi:hypothetical protein